MAKLNGQAHHIDVQVGKRLRAIRVRKSISQIALAEAIGVTFQQVQKYENGANRISCSRLWEISQFLQVPMYVLLGEDPHGEDIATGTAAAVLSQDAQELALEFERLEDAALRAAIRRLVASLVSEGAGS
jgi:transcriptional regulator with XRE-family HTH domain